MCYTLGVEQSHDQPTKQEKNGGGREKLKKENYSTGGVGYLYKTKG